MASGQPAIQYFRPNSQDGLHVFETTKHDTTQFTDMKVRIGGNFTQDFQGLRHSNTATPVVVDGVNTNQLMGLTNGFNRAMANLNVDAQLADGIRMNLTLYLSSRHHEETWVKGGYIQFDKLLFFHSAVIDNIMKNITIKIGDYELDYGDQHYRRTDGGNAIYNPFVENYIMDEFATEIGGEVYYHHPNGLMVMLGITNGELNPTVVKSAKIDSATQKLNTYAPAFHGKLGFDKQLTSAFRFRLTGSFYAVKSTASNTLFFGDRTGSHYVYVMENTQATVGDNAFSGRYNPQFSQQVTTFMINPFLKYHGLEMLATYEMARGRIITERTRRTAKQYAIDLIYRFPRHRENFWIGGRYNSVTATPPRYGSDITIHRVAASAGWFITRNIMLKAEYTQQQYSDFADTDIRAGGKFNGYIIQASIGF
ncbi:hypothetical protein JI741_15815 [Chryseolinea sp. Jin1]|uniref:Porin n=1 Tax=Chryseolinea lacunae TaxID=2801331 RepID=A0ABS1KU17_9BACT|nr:hypothetical protein [Chryseolinea lacunae]